MGGCLYYNASCIDDDDLSKLRKSELISLRFRFVSINLYSIKVQLETYHTFVFLHIEMYVRRKSDNLTTLRISKPNFVDQRIFTSNRGSI